MDVGGGRGELLARCMLYAGHESKGVLFDRQWVLDRCAPVRCSRAACCLQQAACTACDMCSISLFDQVLSCHYREIEQALSSTCHMAAA
jgi:hypothetical protein